MKQNHRPISPHLQVYKPQLTSVLSIFHRVAGVYLTFGIIAVALWVISLAVANPCFGLMVSFYGSPFGKVLLASWGMAFFYHLANGVRHLIWDIGRGYDLKAVYQSGWSVVFFAAIASFFVLLVLFKGM